MSIVKLAGIYLVTNAHNHSDCGHRHYFVASFTQHSLGSLLLVSLVDPTVEIVGNDGQRFSTVVTLRDHTVKNHAASLGF